MAHVAIASASVVAGLAGCGLSEEELERRMHEAGACEPGDECVINWGNDCRCPLPVNAARSEALDEDLAAYDCGGLLVTCRILSEPWCEEGRCVADEIGCCW